MNFHDAMRWCIEERVETTSTGDDPTILELSLDGCSERAEVPRGWWFEWRDEFTRLAERLRARTSGRISGEIPRATIAPPAAQEDERESA